MNKKEDVFTVSNFLSNEIASNMAIADWEELNKSINLLRFQKKYLRDYSQNFKNHFLQARSMMHDLLCKEYDLSESFGKGNVFPFTPSQITPKVNRKGETIIKSNLKERVALSKTTKEHFNTFLRSLENSLVGMRVVIGKENYRLYYVDYPDALLFSLIFIYQDGRDYAEYISDKKPFPRFNPERSASIFSYKTAFSMAMTMYDKSDSKFMNDEDFIFYMIQLYKIDNTFGFFKINKMDTVRKEFMKENHLQRICDFLHLRYQEIISLEKTLIQEIFEDEDFIQYCIKSEYSDPLFVFKCLFDSYLTALSNRRLERDECNYDGQTGDVEFFDSGITAKNMRLGDFIAFCKKKTKQFIDDVITDINDEITQECAPVFDMEQWIRYYFKDREGLDQYAKTAAYGKVNDDYMDYLANMVIATLPRSCYK